MSARTEEGSAWLVAFHAGAREILEGCYRDHFRVVEQAVGQILHGADKETVVHDVFLQLLSSPALRRGFAGGFFRAWLATIARNQAIDYWRRYRRERGLDEAPADMASPDSAARMETSAEAHLFVERFRREALPAKWVGVFETRFLAGLDQRTAAARLGIGRTTLAYREVQVRRLLRRFINGKGRPEP